MTMILYVLSLTMEGRSTNNEKKLEGLKKKKKTNKPVFHLIVI